MTVVDEATVLDVVVVEDAVLEVVVPQETINPKADNTNNPLYFLNDIIPYLSRFTWLQYKGVS